MVAALTKIFGATWIAAVGALALSAPALAGTVETNEPEDSLLTFRGGPGETNDLTVTHTALGPGSWRFTVVDAGAELEAGPGCVSVTAHEASCDLNPEFVIWMEISLGDGDDSLMAETGCFGREIESGWCFFYADGGEGDDHLVGTDSVPDRLFGGEGNDVLEGLGGVDCAPRGGCWGDDLYGNQGDDILRGGQGNDSLSPAGGADVVSGGPGSDSVTYRHRTPAIRVSLDGVADDGEPGEGDNVRPDVEVVFGGRGDDTLIGNDRQNVLNGGLGNDRIFGRGGNDWLGGVWGADLLVGGRGDDRLDLGPGRDRGYGKAGNDYIYAVDRYADLLDGGSGADRAQVNPLRDQFVRVEKVRSCGGLRCPLSLD